MPIPSSNKALGDTGHTTDHNSIAEALSTHDDFVSAAPSTYARLDTANDRLSMNLWAPPAPSSVPFVTAPITAPTYDGSNELVHPSVVYTARAWNGHRYWMAMTPYPSLDPAYENPSILCSDDGITWDEPAGLTNPIEAAPASGINSDPYLAFGPDGYLYCFWRSYLPDSVGAEEVIYYRRSTDGVTWTDKTTVLTNDVSTRRLVSPSLNWDGDRWVMHAVDIIPSPNTVVRLTCDTLTGSWSDPSTVTAFTPDGGRDVWHLDVRLFSGGWHGCFIDATLGDADGGSLFWVTSDDGITWSTTKVLDRTAQALYKPAIFPVPSSSGETIWRIWVTPYTGANALALVTAPIANRSVRIVTGEQMAQAVAAAGPYVVGDAFNRADDAASLGDAASGQTWTASAGTPGILSKRAYTSAAANTRAWIDSGLSDCVVGIEIDTILSGGQQYMVFRATDGSNYWRFGYLSGSGWVLQKVVAAVATTMSTYVGNADNNVCLEVLLSGNDITPSINGVALTTVTDSHAASSTNHGFQTTNTTTRFANFYVRRLVDGV